MHKKLFFGLLCSALVLSACSKSAPGSMTEVPVETPVATTEPAGKIAGTTTVALTTQNGSKQYGTATFTDLAGKTKVSISLSGATFPNPQPAHIHVGACPTPGAVQYPLTDVVNGISETTIDAPYSSLWKGDLALNIHKSAAESKLYTACGDLVPAGTVPAAGDAMMKAPEEMTTPQYQY